jgi:predicted amidohydrolase
MRLSIVQTRIIWEKPEENRQIFSKKLAHLEGQTDLILLPEMFTTGFSMDAAGLAETMEGPTVDWMARIASKLQAVVCGSFICRGEDGKSFFNRLVWMQPDGHFHTYDKKHLFALGDEHRFFIPGKERLLATWKDWRICPLICYDLRFPVWSRNDATDPYDLLIYVANWPIRRSHQWRALLAGRAIENQAFVAGVNIVGTDGNGLEYQGDSTLTDYSGAQLMQISQEEGVYTAELSLEALQHYRRQLPFLEDGDVFKLV